MNDKIKAGTSETEQTQQLAELTWGRAVGLALGWTIGGAVVVAVVAGLLNGLDLVDGQALSSSCGWRSPLRSPCPSCRASFIGRGEWPSWFPSSLRLPEPWHSSCF